MWKMKSFHFPNRSQLNFIPWNIFFSPFSWSLVWAISAPLQSTCRIFYSLHHPTTLKTTKSTFCCSFITRNFTRTWWRWIIRCRFLRWFKSTITSCAVELLDFCTRAFCCQWDFRVHRGIWVLWWISLKKRWKSEKNFSAMKRWRKDSNFCWAISTEKDFWSEKETRLDREKLENCWKFYLQ